MSDEEKAPSLADRILSTPVTWLIAAVNAGIFLMAEAHGSTLESATLVQFGASERGRIWDGEYWRFINIAIWVAIGFTVVAAMDNYAHLGGLAFGVAFAYGMVVARRKAVACAAAGVLLAGSVAAAAVPWPGHKALYGAGEAGEAGYAACRSGDLAGAVRLFDKAERLGHAPWQLYYDRGLAREGLDDAEGALRDYTRALELDPTLADAQANRGLLRDRQGDPAGAIADVEQALKFAPPEWPRRAAMEEWLKRTKR